MNDSRYYTRKQLSVMLKIGFETLLYYEKNDIIPAPERGANGYRLYSEDFIYRIRFIHSAQKMGFSLKEIRFFLENISNSGTNPDGIREVLSNRIKEIDQRIEELVLMKENIQSLKENPDLGHCDILKSLSESFSLEKA